MGQLFSSWLDSLMCLWVVAGWLWGLFSGDWLTVHWGPLLLLHIRVVSPLQHAKMYTSACMVVAFWEVQRALELRLRNSVPSTTFYCSKPDSRGGEVDSISWKELLQNHMTKGRGYREVEELGPFSQSSPRPQTFISGLIYISHPLYGSSLCRISPLPCLPSV